MSGSIVAARMIVEDAKIRQYNRIYNDMKSTDEAITSAVEAIERGDLGQGRATLQWVVREEPDNRLAWVWLAACLNEDEARDECYRRASRVSA